MEEVLLKDTPYQPFSASRWGLAPGVTITLRTTASGRRISGVPALIDTGSEITWIYPRNVNIGALSELERDPKTGDYLIGIEVEGQVYYVTCGYRDHPYAGSEHALLGMNLLENWLTTLNGRSHLLSVTHLDGGGAPARRVEVPPVGEDPDLWRKATFYQFVYSLAGLGLGLVCIVGGFILFIMGISGSINWVVKAEGFSSQLVNAAPGAVLFVVGVLVAWLTRFDVLGSRRGKPPSKSRTGA
jgi:hypothetical protein